MDDDPGASSQDYIDHLKEIVLKLRSENEELRIKNKNLTNRLVMVRDLSKLAKEALEKQQ